MKTLTLEESRKIISSLAKEKERLSTHDKAFAEFWNGEDDFDDICGIEDAEDYIKDGLAQHLINLLKGLEQNESN
jgi:hypothetical protein